MFNVYFHDNLSNEWTEDSFIKSDNFKNIKDIEQFINYCISKNKSRVLNIHQYRLQYNLRLWYAAPQSKNKCSPKHGNW